jgi:archaellum biogenesis ATPase FlaH
MTTEQIILANLISNEEYARKSLPYVKAEYFADKLERLAYTEISKYVEKYNTLPTKESLIIEIDSANNILDSEYEQCVQIINGLKSDAAEGEGWLLDITEKFCQEKSLHNAIMSSISIIDGSDKNKDKGAIPQILSDALSVSFDPNVGHDFLEDGDERFDFYHRTEEKLAFDLEYLNKITKGGLPKKSLNIILAGTGVGKSLAMCHFASANLLDGKNVLYITMEMAEEKIAQRIDANLMNVTLDELETLPKPIYDKKLDRVKGKTSGKLIIKEYPTACAGSGHFRYLLNELKLKRAFVPDIIYVDYLNICMSSRVKGGAQVNSYTLVKAIAEEIRGLAVEFNVPIVSATQTTRSGYSNSDPGLEDTSESFGLPATADFMIALISSEQLEDLSQVMIKQLKNRYGDPNLYKRFVVGIDRSKMRLYDVEQDQQDDIVDDGPVFDKGDYGKRWKEEESMQWATKKFGRKDYSGIKL